MNGTINTIAISRFADWIALTGLGVSASLAGARAAAVP